jgi:hypothetical protein
VTGPSRWRRWRGPLTIGLAVIVLAIAAALANVALLGSTGDDRIGHLRPVGSTLSTTVVSPVTSPPPATTDPERDRDGDD